MRKKWKYKELDEERIDEIVKKFDVPELLATVLVNRGIVDDEEIRVFLNPTRSDFHDPYLMPDMEIAVERIIKAIDNQEKVIIYGDYDVDGITSITVLKKFLKYFIPCLRLEEPGFMVVFTLFSSANLEITSRT